MRNLLLLILALALAWSPASLAHGPKDHGGEESGETSSQAAPQADATAKAAPAEGAVQHDPQLTMASVLENLHPATVHFPIGLLFAAALVELLAWRRRSQRLADAATVMVGAGAIGAVIAAIFGWIHTGLWFGGDGLVQWHRWLGTNLAALALLTWWAGRNPDYRKTFRVLLFAGAGLMLAQGYLGGELAHGPNHLGGHQRDASSSGEAAITAAPPAERDPAREEDPRAVDRPSAEPREEAVEAPPISPSRQASVAAPSAAPAPSPSPTSATATDEADPHAGHDMGAPPSD